MVGDVAGKSERVVHKVLRATTIGTTNSVHNSCACNFSAGSLSILHLCEGNSHKLAFYPLNALLRLALHLHVLVLLCVCGAFSIRTR